MNTHVRPVHGAAARRPRGILGVLVVAAFSTAACGSAIPHEEVVRAAQGGAVPADGAVQDVSPGSEPGVTSGTDPAAGGAEVAGPDGTTPGGAGPSGLEGSTTGTGPAPGRAGETTAPAPVAAGPGDTSPIIIGAIGTNSGAAGAVLKASGIGVQVWASAVNARGGIAGHPVKVIIGDDQADPARYRSLVQDFVENKQVIAFVGNAGPVESGQTYLEQKKVPVVGSGDGKMTWSNSAMHFSVGGDTNALPVGSLTEVKRLGKTKVAILACVETSACPAWVASAEKYAPRVGVEIVYKGDVSIAQASFTSQCLNAQSAGATAMAVVADSNTLYRVARDCDQQGFKPTYIVGTAGNNDTEKAALDGAVTAMHTFPYFGVPGNAVSDEFQAALKKYAPGTSKSQYLATGWASGKVFEQAVLRGIGRNKPTSAGVLKGLRAIPQGETLNGLVLPLRYGGSGPPVRAFCYFPALLREGRYVAPQGMKPTCPAK